MTQNDEHLQAAQLNRAAYLADLQAATDPVERLREAADNNAAEFASIGVRYSYILNAGGLVAVPAIMELLPTTAIDKSLLILPAFLFAIGILSAAATNLLAYCSSLKAARTWAHERNARIHDTSVQYHPPPDRGKINETISKERSSFRHNIELAQHQSNRGLTAFIISVILFMAGVFSAIFILMH